MNTIFFNKKLQKNNHEFLQYKYFLLKKRKIQIYGLIITKSYVYVNIIIFYEDIHYIKNTVYFFVLNCCALRLQPFLSISRYKFRFSIALESFNYHFKYSLFS